MNFQGLKQVMQGEFYLDKALRKGKERAERLRVSVKTGVNRLKKSRTIESERISTIRNVLIDSLTTIAESFPKFRELPPFYRELAGVTLDVGSVKKAVASLNWAKKKIDSLFRMHNRKICNAGDMPLTNKHRREFIGRTASIIKQVGFAFNDIEAARRVMRNYPTIKTSIPTAALFGFPNAGKTTLLARLTGSAPKIAPYAFTTKGINVSYLIVDKKRLQVIDTPGTLNRFEKMNDIERIAWLALEHVSDIIVFVFDPTEGYPLPDQERLYRRIYGMGKDVYCYVSKSDVADVKQVKAISNKFNCITFDELDRRLRLHAMAEKAEDNADKDVGGEDDA